MMNLPVEVEDAMLFGEILMQQYRIPLHQQRIPKGFGFIGEYYTLRGTPTQIVIKVYPEKTEVKAIINNSQCVYQKAYSTKADKRALSKSVGVLKFIEKSLNSPTL